MSAVCPRCNQSDKVLLVSSAYKGGTTEDIKYEEIWEDGRRVGTKEIKVIHRTPLAQKLTPPVKPAISSGCAYIALIFGGVLTLALFCICLPLGVEVFAAWLQTSQEIPPLGASTRIPPTPIPTSSPNTTIVQPESLLGLIVLLAVFGPFGLGMLFGAIMPIVIFYLRYIG